jgi:hypothetical protein
MRGSLIPEIAPGLLTRFVALTLISTVISLSISAQNDRRSQPGLRGLPGARVHAVAASGQGSAFVFCATPAGLMSSIDGGQTWSTVRIAGTADEVLTVGINPKNARVIFAGRRDGLWRTRDIGATWVRLENAELGSAIPLAISFAPRYPSLIYVATARHGLFKTADEGATWLNISAGLPRSHRGTVEEFRSLTIDPRNRDVAYVAHERYGVYRTDDGGESWRQFNDGLSRDLTRPAYTPLLAFDPHIVDRLFMVVGEEVHSHLIRSSVYMTSKRGRWFATELELPMGLAPEGVTLDSQKRVLRVWSDNGVFDLSIEGIPEPVD